MIGGFITKTDTRDTTPLNLPGPPWQHWRLALPVTVAALVGLLALYWETALSMATIWWRSETFAHGMLVVPIVVYMIWVRRAQLTALNPRVEPLGPWLLLGLALVWLLAHVAGIMVGQQLTLVTMLVVLIWTLLGRQVTWNMAFPLGYLFFAVPMGENLVPPLQDFTAWFTVKALQLTNIPVYWEGRFISLPSGDFEVAEACSGMRYLIASVALGCLYAYLTYRSLWRRAVFIAFSAIIPIIANGFRAYGIVMLAHLSDRRLAVGVDHLIYGWVFFGAVVFLMFWVGSLWREPPVEDEPVTAAVAATDRPAPRPWLPVLVLALGLAGVGPVVAGWLTGDPIPPGSVELEAPRGSAGWQGPRELSTTIWAPRFQGADATLLRSYDRDGKQVHAYLAYYAEQRQDAELINAVNALYSNRPWIHLGEETRTLTLGDSTLTVRETRIGAGDHKRLIWHWYRVAGTDTVSAVPAKLLGLWGQITGEGAAVLAVATDYDLRPDEARQRLEQFIDGMGPALLAALPQQD